MAAYVVINSFRDLQNGEEIKPGDPLPEGISEERLAHLVASNCLKPVDADLLGDGGGVAGNSGKGKAKK